MSSPEPIQSDSTSMVNTQSPSDKSFSIRNVQSSSSQSQVLQNMMELRHQREQKSFEQSTNGLSPKVMTQHPMSIMTAHKMQQKIHITQQLLIEINDQIEEKYENLSVLLYYLDTTVSLQISYGQIKSFRFVNQPRSISNVCLINYELKQKSTKNDYLYGVVISNNNDKCTFVEIVSAAMIERKYKIKPNELPKPSRQTASFKRQLIKPTITQRLIHTTDWYNMSKNITSNNKMRLSICRKRWIEACNKSVQNTDLPLIPIMVNDNKNHWIDWIKPIYIESYEIYVSLQFGYNQKEVSLILIWLKHESKLVILSEDLIILIMQFYLELTVKSICKHPKYIYCGYKAVGLYINNKISFDGLNKYDKWVTDIYIHDFESRVKMVCEQHDIDYNIVNECFNKYGVNYEYVENHSRRNFIELLREYDIKVGEAYNIWIELNKEKNLNEIDLSISNDENWEDFNNDDIDDLIYHTVDC